MVALVACETLLLVLLTLLVVGLLRSHAEILRRLGPPEGSGEAEIPPRGSALPQPDRRAGDRVGRDVVGTTLERDAVQIGLGEGAPPTLLAFLSSGCAVCEGFWQDLCERNRPPGVPADLRFIAVTKDPSRESPTRLRDLAPTDLPVIMSSAAWSDYGVPAAPYFVYVEAGRVHGEGSASNWKQIMSLLRDAIDDRAHAGGGEQRASDIDQVLAINGIGPGHPSLYPAERPARSAGPAGPDRP
jgi:hypothetical protein